MIILEMILEATTVTGARQHGFDDLVVAPEDPVSVLRDLNCGEVRTKDTSYLKSQNEVSDMVKATKELKWPGFWYELLQGAWDYNDWSKGSPQITITFAGGESISLAQFVSECAAAGGLKKLKRGRIQEVSVSNNIRGDTGLRPVNVVLTDHDEKDGKKPLGTHGRGLKIASTCVFAGELAKAISYESWVPEMGMWYGEAGMHRDEDDPKAPENFQIKYKRNKELQTDRTVIRVTEPAEDLVEALISFQDWFLPVNGNYRFQRMEAQSADMVPNRATIFANKKHAQEPHDAAVTPSELRWTYGQNKLDEADGVEPPRVEILSRELLPTAPNPINFVFIDGLRVGVPGATFCQIYAFWGWGKGTSHGYNPGRSNDSLKMTGDIDDLLAKTLTLNTNAAVFLEIMVANLNGHKTYEGTEVSYLDALAGNAASKSALTHAWEELRMATNSPADVLITDSKDDYDRAKREQKVALFLPKRWTAILCEIIPGLTTAGTVFSQEFEEVQAKERATRQAMELQQREMEARVVREKEEAIEQYRKSRGIVKEASNTGEVIKMARPENKQITLQLALLHLVHALAMDGGRVVSGDPKKLILEMRAGGFDQLPNNTNSLDVLGEFLKLYLVVFGSDAIAELKIVRQEKGVYFNFARSKKADSFGNYTIEVQQGELELPHDSWVQLELSLPDTTDDNASTGEARQPLTSVDGEDLDCAGYHDVLTQAIRAISNLDGTVDRNVYMASEYFALYPAAEARMRLRMEIEKTQLEMKLLFDEQNKLRVRSGLKPLPYPDELKTTRPRKVGLGAGMGLPPAEADLTPAEEEEKTKQNREHSAARKLRQKMSNILTGNEILDDVPVDSEIISMIHPDSVPGLSEKGDVERMQMVLAELPIGERMRATLAEKMREILNRVAVPDFSLSSGEWLHLRGYLIDHINPAHSITTTDNYDALPALPFTEMQANPCLRFNKKIIAGLYSIPCPPGFHPVAVSHPGGPNIGLHFSGNLEKNVFAMNLEKDVPPGLSFYFEPTKTVDRSLPDQRECEVTADESSLAEHWFNLITSIRESSLTDKQKVDVIIRAWVKAFNYSKEQKAFDEYTDSRGIKKKFTTDIINKSIGNCGYATQGILGLLTLIGIPTRDVAAFLHDGGGNFSRQGNYHGMVQVYIDNRWVLIEPQSGYVQEGYETEELPTTVRTEFENLLGEIPRRYLESARTVAALPDVVGEDENEIPTMATGLRESLRALLPFSLPTFSNPFALLRDRWTEFMQRRRESSGRNQHEATVINPAELLRDLAQATNALQLTEGKLPEGITQSEPFTGADMGQQFLIELSTQITEMMADSPTTILNPDAPIAERLEVMEEQLLHYTRLLQTVRTAQMYEMVTDDQVEAIKNTVDRLGQFVVQLRNEQSEFEDAQLRKELFRANLKKSLLRLSAVTAGATIGALLAPHMNEILSLGATQLAATKQLVESLASSGPNLPSPSEIATSTQDFAQEQLRKIESVPQKPITETMRQYWLLALVATILAGTHTGAYMLGKTKESPAEIED